MPFTTGLLVGIGEAPEDRLQDLLTLQQLHQEYGHIQELIIQNFCPKPATKMADEQPADPQEHLRTIAMARLLFGPHMSIQAPPNLSLSAGAGDVSLGALLGAGVHVFRVQLLSDLVHQARSVRCPFEPLCSCCTPGACKVLFWEVLTCNLFVVMVATVVIFAMAHMMCCRHQ